jgi:hypothetical protein
MGSAAANMPPAPRGSRLTQRTCLGKAPDPRTTDADHAGVALAI